MSNKTLIAISAAIVLGIAGAASTARAGDSGENHQDEDRSATPRINHPGWLGANGAYGYAPAPVHKHRRVHQQTESR
jgi:hypothetical protein